MFLRNKVIINSLSVVALVFFFNNSYGNNDLLEKGNLVRDLCKPQNANKVTYNEVAGKTKARLRIRFFALVNGNADYKNKVWNGIQKVLPKDQAKDNDSYRDCVKKITPIIFYPKEPHKTNFNSGGAKKMSKKKVRKPSVGNKKITKSNEKKPSNPSTIKKAVTYGNKSPIINTIKGNVTFN